VSAHEAGSRTEAARWGDGTGGAQAIARSTTEFRGVKTRE
jgi:hypothetical protein